MARFVVAEGEKHRTRVMQREGADGGRRWAPDLQESGTMRISIRLM